MNTLSKYVLLLLVSFLAACGSDDDAAATFTPVTPQPGDALAVTITASDFVTDGDPDTRATDKGPVTTFEDGDRVGIIILDNKDTPLYNNIPYKYVSSSHTWVFDSNNGEGKEICYYDSKARTYIVYYPYNKDADNCKSESDLKAIFKPQTDQSTKDAYRASDLMVNTITGTPLKSLTAELKHVYASISLSPVIKNVLLDDDSQTAYNGSYTLKITDVNLTIGDALNVPYQAPDGSLRCIVPTDITPGGIRCFYTIGSNTYGNTIKIENAVVANTRYTSSPEIKDVTYSLGNARVGDFYCKNGKNEGYLIPGDVATLTEEQQKACIGIVYCTDIDRIGDAAKKVLKDKGVTTPHGLVMALTNASDACQWGNEIDENSGGVVGTPFQDNTTTLQKKYNNIDGYAETHWIIDTYKESHAFRFYSAFYYANCYGTAEGETSQYAAPNTTTGWFIPSMGQWWDILSKLGKVDLSDYQASEDHYASIPNNAKIAVNNMNEYLEKISDATGFSIQTNFWSSSEYSSGYACHVLFGSDGELDLSCEGKYYDDHSVRCVFAF